MRTNLGILTIVWLMATGCTAAEEQHHDHGDHLDAVNVAVITGPHTSNPPRLMLEAARYAVLQLDSAGLFEGFGEFDAVLVTTDGSDSDNQAAIDVLLEHGDDQGEVQIAGMLSAGPDAHVATANFAVENGIPHFETLDPILHGAGHDSTLHTADEMAFLMSTRPVCEAGATMTAAAVVEGLAAAKVAVLRWDDEHEKAQSDNLRLELAASEEEARLLDSGNAAMGGDYKLADGDGMALILSQVVAAEADAVFFHSHTEGELIEVLTALEATGYTGDVVHSGLRSYTTLLQDLADSDVDDYAADRLHLVRRGPEDTPRLAAFKEGFSASLGEEVIDETAAMYDAMTMLALGIVVTNGGRGAELRDAIWELSSGGDVLDGNELTAAASLLSASEDLDYQGASGSLDFREDGTVPGAFWVDLVEAKDAGGFQLTPQTTPAPGVY